MTRTHATTPRLLAWTLAVLCTLSARADTITLKRSVRLDAGTPVTLADIAELEGAHAERFAGIVIAGSTDELQPEGPSAPDRCRIDPATIRDAIDNAGGSTPVNWAFLSIRGGTATVTINHPDAPQPTIDPTTGILQKPAEKPQLSEVPAGSIGAHARNVVRTILRVRDDDLKIVWPDRHADFLLEHVDGRTVHVQPVGTSERMPLSIRIYDGDRIVRTEIVRAEIRVRRTVRTASRVLTRGTRLAPDDFTTRDIWVGPGLDPATEIVGQVTARRLEPGTKIETTDIEPPLVIERGEQITLHCISGAIAIRSPARALTDARDGEILTVEMSGTNKRVSARANGPGNAVLVVGTTPAETAQHSPKAPRMTAPSAGDRS